MLALSDLCSRFHLIGKCLGVVVDIADDMWLYLMVLGCLKLLPPEKLENLDIPEGVESGGPVDEVLYISSGSDATFVGANTTFSQLHTEDTRFNLFTGNQTFEERDKSFEVIS